MTLNILTIGIIILISVFLNKASSKIGMPTLLSFIVLGLLFGSEGIVKIDFDNYEFASKVCSVALIFIMFYGGFGTNWSEAKSIAPQAILLASLGVVMTAVLVGLFAFYILQFDFLESMLMGAVISSTDAASVFSILRSKRLNLKENTASMLELESGSNDPASYMLTAIVLSIMNGQSSGTKIIYMIFAQVIYALLLGLIIAKIAIYFVKYFDFEINGFDAVFVLSIAILSYAIPEAIGGNGYLSAYIVGIMLGNQNFKNKVNLVHFFNGITSFMQVIIFFLLGLLAWPSRLPSIALPAILIALFITFVARPITVFTILSPFKASMGQKLIVSWSGLRGAASIVFAILATVDPAYMKNDIYHVVFFLVLLSISVQGSLIPLLSKKLNMIDDKENVMKTFTDYQDEEQVGFIQLSIDKYHPWLNQTIKEVSLPPGILIVSIVREDVPMAPNGNTKIREDDILILSALAVSNEITTELTELCADNNMIGKRISEIELEKGKLIIVIKRDKEIIIPDGNTTIEKNDFIVINNTVLKKEL